jgi:hypothetical protein
MSKKLYEQPTTKVLVVRVEGSILVVSGGANWAKSAGVAGGDDAYGENDGELF